MNHSSSRSKGIGSLERDDARALPQFGLPADPVDRGDAAETLERPAVRLHRLPPPVTPRPGRARSAAAGLDPAGGPPPITAEIEVQDILLEAYVAPRAAPRAAWRSPPASLFTSTELGLQPTRPSLPPPNPPAYRSSRSSSSAVRAVSRADGAPTRPSVPPPLRPSRSSITPAPRSRSSVPPPLPRSSVPPPLPRQASVATFEVSSLARTLDHASVPGAPLAPHALSPASSSASPSAAPPALLQGAEPFGAPASPITRPMLPTESPSPAPLPPTSRRPATPPSTPPLPRRPTLETTPSLVPVAMSTSLGLASRAAAADPTMQLRPGRGSRPFATGLALLAAALVAGLVVGAVALVPEGLARGPVAVLDRIRDRAHADDRAPVDDPPPVSAAPVAVAAPEPPVSAAPVAVAAPEPPATPVAVAAPEPPVLAAPPPEAPRAAPSSVSPSPAAPIPAVAVDALPKANVEPGMTLVTFPRSAKAHRIFVDNRVVGSGAAPMKLECGKRKIQIGSRGKARVRELPCGGELALD
ncbi:MAG: hypothetical protein KF764_33090 [Labilithrix sp.]|nr:hypothetical protein [Labilithrix sp.]